MLFALLTWFILPTNDFSVNFQVRIQWQWHSHRFWTIIHLPATLRAYHLNISAGRRNPIRYLSNCLGIKWRLLQARQLIKFQPCHTRRMLDVTQMPGAPPTPPPSTALPPGPLMTSQQPAGCRILEVRQLLHSRQLAGKNHCLEKWVSSRITLGGGQPSVWMGGSCGLCQPPTVIAPERSLKSVSRGWVDANGQGDGLPLDRLP